LIFRFAGIYCNLVDEKGKVQVENVFLGSGSFLSPTEVLTARHVVEAKDWLGKGKYVPSEVSYIEAFDGRNYTLKRLKVKSVRSSDKTDLALIVLEAPRPGSIPRLQVQASPVIGTTLYTLSAPFEELTYSFGIAHSYAKIFYSSDSVKLLISQNWRPSAPDFNVYTLGHNLSIGPGSSGGGVYLSDGTLVGVHVASSRTGSLGYAITGDQIKEFLDAR
jgi:S1-C subfamily serine protease